ncbi:MAG: DNA repair protein RadC [Eubacteriales bacterium]|nr:DNA repair protein RadC [Eubacteriales bacterium]
MNKLIKDVPVEQRPYEKCLQYGPEVLNEVELLAVILKNGTAGKSSLSLAEDVLKKTETTPFCGLIGLLHMSFADLMDLKGIGMVKAIQLKCIGELAKRIAMAQARSQISYDHPTKIAEYYMEKVRHEELELLYCIMLDTKNHLLGEKLISQGTVNSTIASPREVLIEAVKYHAVNIILIHNHPSGDPNPSIQDIQMTKRIRISAELVGITLLDHIIIGDHRYFSLKEEGYMEETQE